MKNYFEESFGGAKGTKKSAPKAAPNVEAAPVVMAPQEADQSAEPVVVFAKSNKEVSCDGDDCLLDVAEQVGVEMASGCRMGSCGVCKHQLIEGSVAYDDEPGGLSESDRDNGQVLVCVARPVGRVVLSA